MTNTNIAATEDYLLRALYAAKAEFKDAASAVATAEHELQSVLADTSACAGDRNDARCVRVNALSRYQAAEKSYNAIYTACRKLLVI
jgi:hypothetical protein